MITTFDPYHKFNDKGFVLIVNIMFHVPKIGDYLKIVTGEEVKDFRAINLSQYFKSIREEENLRKIAKSRYSFLTTPDEVEKYV